MINSSIAAIAIPLGRLSPWFEEALNSALSQTVKVPVYLIANGLQQRENERLQELAKLHQQIKLFVFDQRVGMFENWNRILNLVEEPYFGMLHDDDLLESWAIEKILGIIEKYPNQGIYFTSERIMDDAGIFYDEVPLIMDAAPVILTRKDIEHWAVSNRICATGFLLNRSFAVAEGGYRVDLTYTSDWNLYFAVGAKYGACFAGIHCGRYRFGGKTGQTTNSLAKNGFALSEYKRQQSLNLSRIGLSDKDREKEAKISAAQFAKTTLHHFSSQLGEEGMKNVATTLVDGLIMGRLGSVKGILGNKVCRLLASKFISIKYPDTRKANSIASS